MYSEMRKFWFWAHKVLPLVYDDSLSYYEVLCKVVAKLNECIDKINELGTELDEFEGWTREEFQKVRDEMAAEIQRVEGVISDLDSKVDREVERLDTKIDGVDSRLGGRITAVMANFCGGWVAGSSYQVGSIVRYGDTVYECNTANEDTEFTPAHWTAKTIKSVIDDVNAALESEIQGVIAMVGETREMLAPEYSVTGAYHKTQYVRYAGRLYRARTDIPYPAGDWDSSEWMETPLSNQILRNYDLAHRCYEVLNIPTYSETEHYSVTDVVTHYYNDSDAIWVCKDTDVTGAWDDSKWELFGYVEGSYKELIEKLYLTINNMTVNFNSITYWLTNIAGSAASHNDQFRGADITSLYTIEELYTKVHAGDFDGLYLGDYISVPLTTNLYKKFTGTEFESGVTYYERTGTHPAWTYTATTDTEYDSSKTYYTMSVVTETVAMMIAHFDYYYNCGDSNVVNYHHVILTPRTRLKTASYMNPSRTTVGAYYNSEMHQTILPCYVASFSTALENHVRTWRDMLSTEMSATTPSMAGGGLNGSATAWDWKDTNIRLMNEAQVYGTGIWSSSAYDYGCENRQLAVFRFISPVQYERAYYWLSSVGSSTNFAYVNPYGFAYSSYAGSALYVRPLIVFG